MSFFSSLFKIYIYILSSTFYSLVFLIICFYFLPIFMFILILHCPLSGPDLTYISLLIIFCIIEYVTNKKNLES